MTLGRDYSGVAKWLLILAVTLVVVWVLFIVVGGVMDFLNWLISIPGMIGDFFGGIFEGFSSLPPLPDGAVPNPDYDVFRGLEGFNNWLRDAIDWWVSLVGVTPR